MTPTPLSPWAYPVNRRTLFLFMLGALAVRLVYILALAPKGMIFPDEQTYMTRGMAFIGVQPLLPEAKQAFVMPLYPLVLGALTWLAQGALWPMRVLQAVVSALTMWPVASIAHRLHPTRLTVVLACVAVTLYPFFIFYTSLLLTETLFLFAVTLFFHLLLADRVPYRGAWSGLVAGLGHLMRPVFIFFLPVAWAWQLVLRKVRFSQIILCAVVFALLASTWMVRNYMVLGVPLLTTTTSGRTLYEGNNPFNVDGGVLPEGFDLYAGQPEGLDEVEISQWQKEQALAFIKEDTGRFMRLCFRKFLRFWNVVPNATEYSDPLYKWGAALSFGPVLALCLAGLWVLRRRWRSTVVIWLFIGYVTALHMLTIASIRYRLPLEPLMISMAAACLGKLLSRRAGGSEPHA